jgi:hypothetical protein
MWHTGTVMVELKKPHCTMANFQRLVFAAFYNTGLCELETVLPFIQQLKEKAFHEVYETGERMPSFKIYLPFGYVIQGGDTSHPNAVEVQWSRPDWFDRQDELLTKITNFLARLIPEDTEYSGAPQELFG